MMANILPLVMVKTQLHYLIPENIADSDSDEFASFSETSSSDSSTSDSEEATASPEPDNAINLPEPISVNNDTLPFDIARSQPCSPIVKNLEPSPRSRTRSGQAYTKPEFASTSAAGSSSSKLSKFLSKAGRVAGELMDSHPLATTKQSTSKRKKNESGACVSKICFLLYWPPLSNSDIGICFSISSWND